MFINDGIDKIVWNREEIQSRVKALGKEISYNYQGQELILVGMLKGATFFLADLLRALSVSVQLDFMLISSYGSSTLTTGVVKIIKDLDIIIENRNVLVVEDIIDTGLTLGYLLKNLDAREPASIKVCSFLDKPTHRIMEVPLHYKGFELDNRFVVGYGLDYQEQYRHLPYIATLKREVFQSYHSHEKMTALEGQE